MLDAASRAAVTRNGQVSAATLKECSRKDVVLILLRLVTLEANDPYALGDYGMRLLFMGDLDQGEALLRKNSVDWRSPSSRFGFARFLLADLNGEDDTAARFAGQLTNDKFPLALGTRSIVAVKRGDPDEAKREVDRLYALDSDGTISRAMS